MRRHIIEWPVVVVVAFFFFRKKKRESANTRQRPFWFASLVQEKDSLRKEMSAKIQETQNIYSNLASLDIESQDRRLLVENEKLTLELIYQSRETEKLIDKNSHLLSENKSLKSELRLMKECNQQFARKNNQYKRMKQKL